jgi:hypothetical protein
VGTYHAKSAFFLQILQWPIQYVIVLGSYESTFIAWTDVLENVNSFFYRVISPVKQHLTATVMFVLYSKKRKENP